MKQKRIHFCDACRLLVKPKSVRSCPDCFKVKRHAEQARYRLKHRDRIKRNFSEYRKRNRSMLLLKAKRCYYQNRESILSRQRAANLASGKYRTPSYRANKAAKRAAHPDKYNFFVRKSLLKAQGWTGETLKTRLLIYQLKKGVRKNERQNYNE